MFLLPNGNEPYRTNIDTFGFAYKKDRDGKVKVIGLWEGSPAEKNGLKIGDEIINFSVNEISNIKYEDLFAYSGLSGRQFRRHPDIKPETSGHPAD